MSSNLHRVFRRLPLPLNRRRQQYVPSSWHRPTPFDPCKSQPPFRSVSTIGSTQFRRALDTRRWIRWTLRGGLAAAGAWLAWESAVGLGLF